MTAPAIELHGVGKRFTKYDDIPLLVTSASRLARRKGRSKLWAVRGVDLEVPRGSSFGIIGRNGSGKTTLMAMMAGVTAPTEGMLRVRGRTAPLISVGVGFHQELTGRENIYLNGTILGMTRRQVEQRFDSIVDFAEIEEFIDTPVKFYSSGMFVRLGFAVAIHCDPDVVLIDEILAVGDLGFQVKCYERMGNLVQSGTTVVMVSHNMAAVQKLAESILLLDSGQPVCVGKPEDAISRFHELLDEQPEDKIEIDSETHYERGIVQISSVELVGPDGIVVREVPAGMPIHVRVTAEALAAVPEVVAGFCINGPDGQVVYMDSNVDNPFGPLEAETRAVFTMSLRAALPTGSYTVAAWLQRPFRSYLARGQHVSFYVTGRATVRGTADLEGIIAMDELSSELPEVV